MWLQSCLNNIFKPSDYLYFVLALIIADDFFDNCHCVLRFVCRYENGWMFNEMLSFLHPQKDDPFIRWTGILTTLYLISVRWLVLIKGPCAMPPPLRRMNCWIDSKGPVWSHPRGWRMSYFQSMVDDPAFNYGTLLSAEQNCRLPFPDSTDFFFYKLTTSPLVFLLIFLSLYNKCKLVGW